MTEHEHRRLRFMECYDAWRAWADYSCSMQREQAWGEYIIARDAWCGSGYTLQQTVTGHRMAVG